LTDSKFKGAIVPAKEEEDELAGHLSFRNFIPDLTFLWSLFGTTIQYSLFVLPCGRVRGGTGTFLTRAASATLQPPPGFAGRNS
jgi:hypothetical protein